jgi:hypothetical protein
MIALLRKLFGRRAAPRPPCRLTEAQALEIARGAVGVAKACYVRDVVQSEAGVEWLIGTATLGSGRTIRISDATGEVLEKQFLGCAVTDARPPRNGLPMPLAAC